MLILRLGKGKQTMCLQHATMQEIKEMLEDNGRGGATPKATEINRKGPPVAKAKNLSSKINDDIRLYPKG